METTLNSRFFRVQLMLVLIIVTVFSVEAYDFMENGIAYNINEDGASVEVTYQRLAQSGYSNLSGDIVIPSSVYNNGTEYTVTSIGRDAFRNCINLTSVVIPISVTKISFKSFMGCSGLTSVEIPGSVTEIGESAFYDCINLSSLHIPGSVTSIEPSAFYYCGGLSSITVEESNAFYDSRDNCNAIIETSTNTLIAGCKNTIIPGSVTSIGYGAFYYCTSLTSITIPNSVKSIGSSAFTYCYNLTSVTIPNSVMSIGTLAFRQCI